ncbi:MAG: sugar transferase [Eubacterium sp.]|nr:sugar transferase [Eubacterium sp.]
MIIRWSELPETLRRPEVKKYYKRLYRRRGSLLIKRGFDIAASLIMILLLAPVMLGVAVWIKLDSKGPVFFRQERITQYGRRFRIFKFRTMVADAEQLGTLVTVEEDPRITKVGKKIRSKRLDELPQLFNILAGDMTFVGTRPEVLKYVEYYRPEWMATLLLPAGVTSSASVAYKDEDAVMQNYREKGYSVDEIYTRYILPEKMRYNLEELRSFSLWHDMKILVRTVLAVI